MQGQLAICPCGVSKHKMLNCRPELDHPSLASDGVSGNAIDVAAGNTLLAYARKVLFRPTSVFRSFVGRVSDSVTRPNCISFSLISLVTNHLAYEQKQMDHLIVRLRLK